MLWSDQPAEKDYVGAESFLLLCLTPKDVAMVVAALRRAQRAEFAVKDILRQSRLPLLSSTDSQVQHVLHKDGKPISPVLLLRGDLKTGRPLIVADGYHRVCAAYHLADDTMVPCHITDFTC